MNVLEKLCIAVLRFLKLEYEGRKFEFTTSVPLSATVVTLDVHGDALTEDALKGFVAKIREVAPNFTTVHEMELPPEIEYIGRWRDAETNLAIRGLRVFDPIAKPSGEFINRFDIAVS